MTDEPQKALMRSLEKLFINSDYSDLTVRCGQDEYNVHRALICPRSGWFENSCKRAFKEGLDQAIRLPQDERQAVRLMIYYFYHLDYPHVSLYGDDISDVDMEESPAETVKAFNGCDGSPIENEEEVVAESSNTVNGYADRPIESTGDLNAKVDEAAVEEGSIEFPSNSWTSGWGSVSMNKRKDFFNPEPQPEPERIVEDVLAAPANEDDDWALPRLQSSKKKKETKKLPSQPPPPEDVLAAPANEDDDWALPRFQSSKKKKKTKKLPSPPPPPPEEPPQPEPDPSTFLLTLNPPNLILHARVYALADKYFVHGLKALALQKFSAEAATHWSTTEFPQAAREVYTSTLDSDKGLRDVVVETLFRHPEMLGREDVRACLRGEGMQGLGCDFLEAAFGRGCFG